jgi:recombination protein RecA
MPRPADLTVLGAASMPSRRRKLEAVVARLQLQYGPRAIRQATATPVPAIPHLSTTFPALDATLGSGGLPRGRISEIVGPATSGKVTLAAKVLASAHQDRTALVAWIDLSRTCDPDYLQRCGLDLERLLVVRPDTGADALAITLHLVESNALAALVFDGLAALAAHTPGVAAGAASVESVLAGTLERLAAVVTRTETAVIFLSEPQVQYRTLAHLATVRLEIRREHWLWQGREVSGYEGHVKVLKHKLGQAGGTVVIHIVFNGTVRSRGLL